MARRNHSNDDSSNNKPIMLIVLIVLIAVYLIIPPHDKIAQIGYTINNIKFSMGSHEIEAYVFHRNNAVYLTKMNKPEDALREIDKAIETVPSNANEATLNELYRDRANIKMFFGEYKGALNDFLRIPNHGINDYLTIAMLLKENGKKKLAVSYCNKIIELDLKAYAGYACIADIYASAGKYEAAVMIYDLLLDRSPNKARYYADRAMYKEKLGDYPGAREDYQKAKELSPVLDYNSSITYDAIHPKRIDLTIF